ncbi:MAG: hypothetical protein IJ223_05455 [Clostridia bacterium]|nr:hypothetical protein [Clostridia bacterium]
MNANEIDRLFEEIMNDNEEAMPKVLENKEKIQFNKKTIIDLIIGTKNPEFIDKCIQK